MTQLQEAIDCLGKLRADIEHFTDSIRRSAYDDVGTWRVSLLLDVDETIEALRALQSPDVPTVTQKHYNCGCVTCVCEDEERCHGCGAKSCRDKKTCSIRRVAHEYVNTPSEGMPDEIWAYRQYDSRMSGNWSISEKKIAANGKRSGMATHIQRTKYTRADLSRSDAGRENVDLRDALIHEQELSDMRMDKITELQAANEKLRKALAVYAGMRGLSQYDGGKLAREALKGGEE